MTGVQTCALPIFNSLAAEYSTDDIVITISAEHVHFDHNTIPAVAVPYTKKSLELAERWSKLEQIQKVGIRFILVQENGNIKTV